MLCCGWKYQQQNLLWTVFTVLYKIVRIKIIRFSYDRLTLILILIGLIPVDRSIKKNTTPLLVDCLKVIYNTLYKIVYSNYSNTDCYRSVGFIRSTCKSSLTIIH